MHDLAIKWRIAMKIFSDCVLALSLWLCAVPVAALAETRYHEAVEEFFNSKDPFYSNNRHPEYRKVSQGRFHYTICGRKRQGFAQPKDKRLIEAARVSFWRLPSGVKGGVRSAMDCRME